MFTRKLLRVPLGAVVAGLLLTAGLSGEAEAGDRDRHHGYHSYYDGPLFGLFFGYPSYEKKRYYKHKYKYSFRPHSRHKYYSYRDYHRPNHYKYYKHKYRGHKYGHRGHRGHRYRH